ncbi:inositol monophosphatase family protein [Ligilactobacillus cholophilus]|uniref:inositol monophosphatase family protein n=1 Tax=Ligilactobacillus cholophilus TaxID=3050131 RepID=UPI002AA712A7|nr:inositol monophosphatase family protein [uncultured Ligilactobacillus sp.]
MHWEKIDEKIKLLMFEARKMALESFDTKLNIKTKSNRNDLVTNMDKTIEKFYIDNIKENFPNAKIMGEESEKDQLKNSKDLFFVIDPIDGTMNFVKEKNHFASMIAVYDHQKPILGYIMDMCNGKLYWGGPNIGVFENYKKLEAPRNSKLEDGLLGMGLPMILNDEFNMKEIAKQTSGIRMYGSAGIEFIHVLKGETIGYVSKLHAWDYAAGKILAETLNLTVDAIDGSDINVLSSKIVLVATKSAQAQINQLIHA